ncbi:MAG: hypothetical protein KAQ67_05480 [Gammaproteobacteria bacterium]|nr:hypothetical protein [Gammaproteobacteria bacterium]
MHHFYLSSFLFLILISNNIFCSAAEVDEDTFTRLELDLISLYNPLGISVSANGFYRKVYRHDESALWNGLYYQAGAQANLNPAFARAGIHVEWMPIAILQLRLQYDRLRFSGSNGSLLSFASSNELFGDDELESREGQEVSGYGDRSLLKLTLRAQFANTIVRNVTDLSHYKFPGAGPYYLEREYEILMAAEDDVVSNQLFLLFESKIDNGKIKRYIGPYHDYVHVRQSDLTRERLGLTWFQEYETTLGIFNKPRWYIQLGSYLKDQNRQDEIYLVFGIGGDINW